MAKIIKALLDNEIALTIIDSTDIVAAAIEIFKLSEVAAVALGRTLTVCSMMGAELKSKDDNMTAVVSGNGPIGKITVCADSSGNVKGFVENPHIETVYKDNGKPDVGRAVGLGRLTIVKSMGLREPYVGSSNIQSGEISDDFAAYFYHSEQRPSAVTAGVVIENGKCVRAVGILLRLLPSCSFSTLEKFSKTIVEIKNNENAVCDISEILSTQFSEYSINQTEEKETFYRCDCSKERIERVILSLGKGEIFNILAAHGKIELVCDFCTKRYVYEKDEVIKLVNPLYKN